MRPFSLTLAAAGTTAALAGCAGTPFGVPTPKPATPAVWMRAQLIPSHDGEDIYLYARPTQTSPITRRLTHWVNGLPNAGTVGVVCSVRGPLVTTYGDDGEVRWRSSNWDRVTTNGTAGWVADVYLDTHGARAPLLDEKGEEMKDPYKFERNYDDTARIRIRF